MKYPKYFGSSVNPEELGLTVRGLFVGLVPLVVFVAGQFGVDLTANSLMEVVNLGLTAVSALIVFVGVVRKVVVDVLSQLNK